MTTRTPLGPGKLVAHILHRAWRPAPPPLELSEAELTAALPLLLGSGSAALAWWRIRHQPLAASEPARRLEEAYRAQVLFDAVRRSEIEQVLDLLEQSGIDPVFFKGWAVATLYADTTLRPSGDIDVFVHPEELPRASAALHGARIGRGSAVDLQAHFTAALDDSTIPAVLDRTRRVPLAAREVRVLSPEDQLGMLCVHFLRHGGWRPIWLCDVAAAMEHMSDTFDWNVCLGKDRRRAGWILATLRLAEDMLGAECGSRLPGTVSTPRWLRSAIEHAWNMPYRDSHESSGYRASMTDHMRHPTGLWSDLLARWPNPVTATVYMHAPMNSLPRLPFQIAYSAVRGTQFLLAGLNAMRRAPGTPVAETKQ